MNHYETFEPAPDTWQIEEPGTVIADSLILTLRESNALEFMPQELLLQLPEELMLLVQAQLGWQMSPLVNIYS